MCKVESAQEEGRSGPTPQDSPVRAARLRAGISLLGGPGESWNHWFLKGQRAVLESLLWSVLNAIHAPGAVSEIRPSSTNRQWNTDGSDCGSVLKSIFVDLAGVFLASDASLRLVRCSDANLMLVLENLAF